MNIFEPLLGPRYSPNRSGPRSSIPLLGDGQLALMRGAPRADVTWISFRCEADAGMFDRVETFVRDVRALGSEVELAGALADITRDLGFAYFALTHHVDVRRSNAAIRIHNYPDGWADWFDEHSLGGFDPVHRASNITGVGFAWSDLPE